MAGQAVPYYKALRSTTAVFSKLDEESVGGSHEESSTKTDTSKTGQELRKQPNKSN